MANPYPADVADSGGNVRLSGAITFTDANNQPGGGGGLTVTKAVYRGDNTSIPNTGQNTRLTWDTLLSGDALLDLSVPLRPTVLTAGVYAVTVNVVPATSMTDGTAYTLKLDMNGGGASAYTLETTVAVTDSFDFDTFGCLTGVYPFEAGAYVQAIVQQADVGAVNFSIATAAVVRFG